MERNNLTKQDLEVIRSFILPIQQNIPLADNPKLVTTVLLMLTCGTIEHYHFGTEYPSDASFESQEDSWGFELFSGVNTQNEIQQAALSYLMYLRTGRKIDPVNIYDELFGTYGVAPKKGTIPVNINISTDNTQDNPGLWARFKGFLGNMFRPNS